MGILNVSQAFADRYGRFDPQFVFGGWNTTLASGERVAALVLGNGDYLILRGTGFTYNTSGGFAELTGGTVTAVEFWDGAMATRFFNFSGLNVAIPANFADYSIRWSIASLFFAGNDTINGSGGNERLFGYAGNDSMVGNGGSDTFRPGAGQDTVVGGAGFADRISYVDYRVAGGTAASIGVTIDLNGGTVVDPWSRDDLIAGTVNDTFSGIETAEGTVYADVLTGNAQDNTLTGFAGNDNISGGLGNDLVDGAAGRDTLAGGDGFDVLTYATYTSTAGLTFNLHLAQQTVVETGGATDRISGFESYRGSNGNDRFRGSTADETFVGNAGNDTFTGGGGIDTVRFDGESFNGGVFSVVVNLTTGTGTDRFGDTDTFADIDNVVGAFQFAAFGDSITGNSAANRLEGMAGSDTLIGGGGNDTLIGGNDNDTMTGGLGADSFVLGASSLAQLGVETITDFSVVADRVLISKATFGLGASNATIVIGAANTDPTDPPGPNPTLFFDRDNDTLWFNPGESDWVQVAVFTSNPTLVAGSFVFV
jgi:Ca2+-binding RTX toxin-like protein